MHLTLTEMCAAVRSRKISPVELVDAHLKQIETHNPKVNAFIRVLGDEARDAAKQAQETKGDLPALHGIPVSIKDSFNIAGQPTTCGSKLYGSIRAGTDATCVARFKASGAIPIGKTNCPEFLSSY